MHRYLVGLALVLMAVAAGVGASGCGPQSGEPGSEAAIPRIADSDSGDEARGIGFDSAAALWERMDALRSAGGVTACTAEISRAHQGWSQTGVEDRYGSPSSIDLDETGLLLTYTRDLKDSPVIVFTTNEGVVSTACLRER
jgi:hypothetical protein